MTSLKRIFISVVLLLGIQWANAQTGLGIYTNDNTFDTVQLGADIPLNVFVRNDTGSAFSGAITFNYNINFDTTVIAIPDTASGLEFTPFFTTLNPGDSVGRSIIVHVNGPRFQVGPSVVVIWPKAVTIGGNTLDSLVLHILVLPPNGIARTEDDKMRIFVSGNLLHIESESAIELKRVRIMDIAGKELFNQSLPANNIPLPEMYAGVYLAEITYNNNQRRVFRFLH